MMTEQPPSARLGHRPGSAHVAALIPQRTAICGRDGVISGPMELRTYECDGLTA